jgi:hypothetical protein
MAPEGLSDEDLLILAMVEKLRQHGGLAGNTHLQKGLYLAKTLLRVPVLSPFKLYTHGPFSHPIETRVKTLVERGHLRHHAPIGRFRGHYSLPPGTRARVPCEAQLDFVARRTARWPAGKLETVMTTLYLRRGNMEFFDAEIRSQLVQIKDHVSKTEARTAAAVLDELIDEAVLGGVIIRQSVSRRARITPAQRNRIMTLKAEREAVGPASLEAAEIAREIEEVLGGRHPTRGWAERPGAPAA